MLRQLNKDPNSNPGDGAARQANFLDRVSYLGFLFGLMLLCMQMGMLCAAFDLPPYRMTEDAIVAIDAVRRQSELRDCRYHPYLWDETNFLQSGVVEYDEARCFNGYTLYGTGHGSSAHLIDMEGAEVHRWEISYQNMWSDAPHVDPSLPNRFVIIRRAITFPNGDLLAQFETPAASPAGIGLAKLDRESRVLWRVDINAHHDMDVDDEGGIFVLTHSLRTDALDKTFSRDAPFIEESITQVSPQGEVIKTISLHEIFTTSPFFRSRTSDFHHNGDFLHSNTIHVVGPQFAAQYEEIESGDLMICLRNFNLVIVLNPGTEQIVWSTSGPWHHPHDPDPLPNGNLLIFDNCFQRGSMVASRVLEFDPTSDDIVWSFFEEQGDEIRSDIRACQQLLPNGNVLITESDRGRLLEVTRDGEIVWEFINPARGDERELIPIVVGATRMKASAVPFVHSRARQIHSKG